ncbi:hypothetical protein B296_00030478 [Ensete ventricosum]|uniref:Uncharacterized protein n=1 Tax=Ensete ventricosum TaxID=4639 RepID=A0A426YIH0_ENSVE|nr:hypothetical protein B296_00030478 [Ensete ventricosum]
MRESNVVLRAVVKELKPKGGHLIQGFESGLEKMGWVSYEFGYRVALERFRAKYPDSTVEENPFAKLLEDVNVKMDLCQPFDDSTAPEK